MTQWKNLGWGVAVDECPYVVKKDITLRMVFLVNAKETRCLAGMTF